MIHKTYPYDKDGAENVTIFAVPQRQREWHRRCHHTEQFLNTFNSPWQQRKM